MPASIDLVGDDVLAAVRTFLLDVLPDTVQIIATQDNGLSMPPREFVALTPHRLRRLETNVATYADPGANPGTQAIRTATEAVVQLDCYGPNATQYAAVVGALFRDTYAVDRFPADIVPLYADDAVQLPLVTGETTWLMRWTLDLHLQINPVVTVAQDFAAALEVGTAGHPVTAATTTVQPWNGIQDLDTTVQA
jgi:hypothetical protein